MNINQYYKTLNVNEVATDEEISAAYKRLAMQYHPDRNLGNTEWATEAMKNLNVAYSAVMSHRFSNKSSQDSASPYREPEKSRDIKTSKREKPAQSSKNQQENDEKEIHIHQFVKIREKAKDSIYRYFQYGLFNIPRRENAFNRGIYNEIVFNLRRSYHSINSLGKKTKDKELHTHYAVFKNLLFNFYKSSECINIIDSYNNKYEVDAYRIYVRGDEKLHQAHKEIFFDRHNRGYFKGGQMIPLLNQAAMYFSHVINDFSSSSWVVEARIKIEYIQTLKDYLNLFFTED